MFKFEIYSPEEEIFHPLMKEKGVRLFIKRDDMIHPFISGNKWRKLKYHLLAAKQKGKNRIVTFGGVWSNHLLATACAAAKFGMKATAFVRGEDVKSDTLLFCRMFGMDLKFTDRESYRNKQQLFQTHFGEDHSALFVNEGGAGEEAVTGCSELIGELENTYDHVFCAAGTGATAAGLLQGIVLRQLSTTLHVVPALKGAHFLEREISTLANCHDQLQLHPKYHFGGYAKTETALLNFINRFSEHTGILLDPVYTGKMMFAIFDLVEQGYFTPGSNILAVHTGGLFGLLGMKERIGATLASSSQVE